MICQRLGCENEVKRSRNGRTRFCPEHREEAKREWWAAYLAKHRQTPEPFVCRQCGMLIYPVRAHKNRACCGKPECRKAAISERVRAWWKRNHPEGGRRDGSQTMAAIPRDENKRVAPLAANQKGSVPLANGVLKASLKENRVVDGKMALVDRGAELAGIDRGTREGFKRYMEERPFYFGWVFPRMTIAEAWQGVSGGRRE